MTENKRFDDAKSYVYDGKNCIGIINDDFTCENIINLLNAFHEENEELKQFKQNVFGLIDKNLEKDKHEYEMTYEDYLNGRIEVLEELKKELK